MLGLLAGIPGSLAQARRAMPALAERLRELPWPAVAAAAALGLATLLFGARQRRALAVAGGVALGWLAAAAAPAWVAANVGVRPGTLGAIAAVLLAAAGGLYPPLFPIAVGALPGVFLGAALDGEGLGPAAWFLAGGALGAIFGRWVAAGFAAALGAALLAAAALAAGEFWPALRLLSARPALLVALAAVLAIGGAAFQVRDAWRAPWRRSATRPEGSLPPDRAETVAERR